jgi:hypothetical protein
LAHQFVCGNDKAAREGGKKGNREGEIACLDEFGEPLEEEEVLEDVKPVDTDEEVDDISELEKFETKFD